MSACLDSWAVLSWLQGREPAFARVEELIGARPVMSWINVAEVYYRIERDHGRAQADEDVQQLRTLLRLDLPSSARVLAAARIKAGHAIALADCFAVATAMAHRVPLLTGDPELIDATGLGCSIEDLRAPARGARRRPDLDDTS